MNVSVVIVSWNVRDLLRQSLTSVAAEAATMPGSTTEVIVVDNASSDGTPEIVRREFPSTQLVVNTENLGFAAACNQAFERCNGDAVLLLNPDAALQPGSLRVMVEYLEAHPDVGSVGPKVLNPDGSTQSSRRRFPTLATALLESTVLQSYFPNNPHLARYYCHDRSEDAEQEVDWLVGACVLIRKTTLDAVGGLDERFFMYFEEVDWSLRAHRAGWRSVYLPDAQALHHYGQSSGQDLRLRHIRFTQSKCRFYAKHWGRAAGLTVRAFLLLSYAWQLAEESAKLLLRHKPALRRERIQQLSGVLKWGLLG